MRRLLRGLACTLLLASAPVAAQERDAQAGSRFFPYEIKTDRLENGLSVTRIPFPSNGLVAFYAVVRVGSRNEVEEGHTGFAHFFEHMMFRGTEKYPAGERDRWVSKLGFADNAFTTTDLTMYTAYGPTAGLSKLIEIEADRFQNLEYSEQDFQTEAKAVLGEYHKNAANPARKLNEVLMDTAYERHTYKHTTLGFYEDIKKMPEYFEYSRTFFDRWYTPDNTMLFFVGDFDDAQVMREVRENYGRWDKEAAKLDIPREPGQPSQKVAHVDWDAPTLPRLVFAWHSPAASLKTNQAQVQELLAQYLVGPVSQLHESLVLERQIAESVGSHYYEHRDPTLFSLAAVLKEEKHLDAVTLAFNRAIRNLARGRIDPRRVEAAKDHVRYQLLMSLQTPKDVAESAAWYAGVMGSPDAIARYYEAFEGITPRDLLTFVREHMTARNRTIVTLSTERGGAKSTQQGDAQKKGGN